MRALLAALGLAALTPTCASAADFYLTESRAGHIRVIDVESLVADGEGQRLAEVRRLGPTTITEKVRFDCRAGRYEILWRLSGAAGEQTTAAGFPPLRPEAKSPQALEMQIACQDLRPAKRRLGDKSLEELSAMAVSAN